MNIITTDKSDFSTTSAGSMVGFHANTPAVREWLLENTDSSGWGWLGDTLWVDYRFAQPLFDGLLEAGFSNDPLGRS